jgi:TonB-dependent receptor
MGRCRLPRRPTTLTAFIIASVLFVAVVLPTRAQDRPVGAIRGTVYDEDFDVPLARVRVAVIGTTLTAITTSDGTFLFDQVPPGAYTLTFAKPGYERQVSNDVVVVAGRLNDVGRVNLGAEIIEMEELVVTGADLLADNEIGLLEIRAEEITIQDAISADFIKKAGVSDAAGALRLVTGASVVDGRYATVRGMSDRYTGTTLNGLRVPSPDPRKRAVQIDIFPAGTIENVTVTKTFSPELQGDFTGGGVNIQTKSIPAQSFFTFGVGLEYNTEATFSSDFLTYRGGGVTATGIAGSERELPKLARETPPKSLAAIDFSPNPSQEDIEASLWYDRLTSSFMPAMGTTTKEQGPDGKFSIAGGNVLDVGKGVIGLMGALTYNNKYDLYLDGRNNTALKSGATLPISLKAGRQDNRGTEELLIGALANVVWQSPTRNHEIGLKGIFNQATEDQARLQIQDSGPGAPRHNQTLHYIERNLTSTQLIGRHDVGEPWTVDWAVAVNDTSQKEPDVRFFQNVFDERTGNAAKPDNSTDALNTRRIFREVGEDNRQFAGNVFREFKQWGGLQSSARFGFVVDRTDREYTQDSLTYTFTQQDGSRRDPGKACNSSKGSFTNPKYCEGTDQPCGSDADCEDGVACVVANPDALWTDVFTDDNRTGLAPEFVYCDFYAWPSIGIEDPQPTPAANQLLWAIYPMVTDVQYTGEQTLDGAYGMVDLPLHTKVTLTAGARYETTQMKVFPEGEFGLVNVVQKQPEGNRIVVQVRDEDAITDLDEPFVLPSAAVTWRPMPNMNVRAVWAETIARPTFRELAPVSTEEFIDGDEFLGTKGCSPGQDPAYGDPNRIEDCLTLSQISNYDLRWEWFRRPGEVLALSVFYKDIMDPIEFISFDLNGTRTVVQPINFRTGNLRGFEFEGRTSLGFAADWLEGLTIGGNYTQLDSEVDVLEEVGFGLDEETRQLQGQPANLTNVFLTYDNGPLGISSGLFFNRTGETLLTGAAAGDNGTPSVYELPYSFLNFTFSKRIKQYERGALSLSFRAKNIQQTEIEREYRAPDGDSFLKSKRKTPAVFSIGAKWSW